MAAPAPTRWIGVMSGTSLDGIDAVRCHIDGKGWHGVEAVAQRAWPDALRKTLLALQQGHGRLTAAEWAALDQAVSDCYLDTIRPLVRNASVTGIGLHGQTVFHDGNRLMTSLQLGNPHWIAARTGCLVVHDFRRADMALGGQGAPLVPAFHQAVFAHADERRVVVNIGGISNLTRLGTAAEPLIGYDVGPGNALMDEWIQLKRGAPFDNEGLWASSGQVIDELVDAALQDAWFARPPPKSTGRDFFSLSWLDALFPGWREKPAENIQRSLLEITAIGIARETGSCNRLLVCGGGAHNRLLMRRLSQLLPAASVETTAAFGLDAQHVECAAFAWLAERRHAELTGAWHLATGASRAAFLGCISLPPAALS